MYMFCLLADSIIYCCTLAIAHVVGGVSAFLDCFSELCFKVGLSSSSVSAKQRSVGSCVKDRGRGEWEKPLVPHSLCEMGAYNLASKKKHPGNVAASGTSASGAKRAKRAEPLPLIEA